MNIISDEDFKTAALFYTKTMENLYQIDKSNPVIYYLSGYVVECALKAIILKQVPLRNVFLSRRESDRFYTHLLQDLLVMAELNQDSVLIIEPLRTNWEIVSRWRETSRYQLNQLQTIDIESIYDALLNLNQGVFPWLQSKW